MSSTSSTTRKRNVTTILSSKGIQTLLLRELRAAGGSLPADDLYSALARAGVGQTRARREVDHLAKVHGRLVIVNGQMKIPTRYANANDDHGIDDRRRAA